MSRRLDEHVPYPQGWKAADAGSQSQWIYSLPAELIQAYAAGVGEELDATGKLLNSWSCLLYTSPSPRDGLLSRMPSSA